MIKSREVRNMSSPTEFKFKFMNPVPGADANISIGALQVSATTKKPAPITEKRKSFLSISSDEESAKTKSTKTINTEQLSVKEMEKAPGKTPLGSPLKQGNKNEEMGQPSATQTNKNMSMSESEFSASMDSTQDQLDISTEYQSFIKKVFPKNGIPPIICYDKTIRNGNRIYQTVSNEGIEPKPANDEHWLMLSTKSELPVPHRNQILQYITVDYKEKTMFVCISEYIQSQLF